MTPNQLANHTRVVQLDTALLTLVETIRNAQRDLEAAVKERARLTGEDNYLAWIVCTDGTVQTKAEVFAKLPAPPKRNVIEITPVQVPMTINGQPFHMGAGDHIAMLTGTWERFEQGRVQAEREQVLTP